MPFFDISFPSAHNDVSDHVPLYPINEYQELGPSGHHHFSLHDSLAHHHMHVTSFDVAQALVHIKKALVHATDAHHTSREHPEHKPLAQTFEHLRQAQKKIEPHAWLDRDQEELIYGPGIGAGGKLHCDHMSKVVDGNERMCADAHPDAKVQ